MARLAKIRGVQILETVMRDRHFDANNPINEDKVDINWEEHLAPLTDIATREEDSVNGHFSAGDYVDPEGRVENIEEVVDKNLNDIRNTLEELKNNMESQLAPYYFQAVDIYDNFNGEVVLDAPARVGTVYLWVNGTLQKKELVTENIVAGDKLVKEHVDKVIIPIELVTTRDKVMLFYTPIDNRTLEAKKRFTIKVPYEFITPAPPAMESYQFTVSYRNADSSITGEDTVNVKRNEDGNGLNSTSYTTPRLPNGVYTFTLSSNWGTAEDKTVTLEGQNLIVEEPVAVTTNTKSINSILDSTNVRWLPKSPYIVKLLQGEEELLSKQCQGDGEVIACAVPPNVCNLAVTVAPHGQVIIPVTDLDTYDVKLADATGYTLKGKVNYEGSGTTFTITVTSSNTTEPLQPHADGDYMGGAVTKTVTTDVQGNYTITGIRGGDITVEITGTGYEAYNGVFTLTGSEREQSYETVNMSQGLFTFSIGLGVTGSVDVYTVWRPPYTAKLSIMNWNNEPISEHDVELGYGRTVFTLPEKLPRGTYKCELTDPTSSFGNSGIKNVPLAKDLDGTEYGISMHENSVRFEVDTSALGGVVDYIVTWNIPSYDYTHTMSQGYIYMDRLPTGTYDVTAELTSKDVKGTGTVRYTRNKNSPLNGEKVTVVLKQTS